MQLQAPAELRVVPYGAGSARWAVVSVRIADDGKSYHIKEIDFFKRKRKAEAYMLAIADACDCSFQGDRR